MSNGSRQSERDQGEKKKQKKTCVKQHLCFDVLINGCQKLFECIDVRDRKIIVSDLSEITIIDLISEWWRILQTSTSV